MPCSGPTFDGKYRPSLDKGGTSGGFGKPTHPDAARPLSLRDRVKASQAFTPSTEGIRKGPMNNLLRSAFDLRIHPVCWLRPRNFEIHTSQFELLIYGF